MSPRYGYRRTVFALIVLCLAAVAAAVPYDSLFGHSQPDVTLAASLHEAAPAPSASPSPAALPIAQNDPQGARIAQASALASYQAKVVRRDRRRRAEARADAQATLVATPVPSADPAPSAPPVAQGSPQQIATGMLGSYGWSLSQFGCLLPLWNEESGWNPYASNPGSGAYGIPQALPGDKMASAGADWQTNPATQIRWGLGYIQGVYGDPCGAWAHEQAYGWY
jgi:hypothetical protein